MTLSLLGSFSIYLAIFFSFIGLLKTKWQRFCFFQSALLPLFSFLLLLYLFISSDMNVKNVFLNSSSTLPLIYKISASWASHEGSLLLWLALFGIVNMVYFSFSFPDNRTNLRESSLYQTTFCLIAVLFLSTILYTSNPFETFSFVPGNGLGLNPMLQDMAILIHPPILYLGNVLFSPIFISTIAISHVSTKFQSATFIFNQKILSIALSALTFGIGLGSWWAYRELGWGGYWFFDPVENISLLPWLTGIILHHQFLIYQKDYSDSSARNITLFSLLSFLLILYGMFIVRSGIIASVHSFAFSPQRGLFIFAICFIVTLVAIYRFFGLANSNARTIQNQNSILINFSSIFWGIALFLIVISLIYPIYCYLYHDEEVSIDVNYFYQLFLPVFIPLLFSASFILKTKFVFNLKEILTNNWDVLFLLVLSCISTIWIKQGANFSLISFLLLLGSIFLCLSMIYFLITTTKYFSQALTNKKLALFLTHFGFGLLALAVNLNVHFTTKIDFSGAVGDQVRLLDKIATLENIKFSQNDNYYRQIAVFKIEHGNDHVILQPENRLYKTENSLSQEADIYSYLFQDIYAVISRVKGEIVEAQIYFQPLIMFIWLSIIMMSLGFLLSAFDKRRL
jgi:cytochrome c-type biogenesis protein CcmF